MQDSIFTRIIKGEIPCEKVYEDSKTLAFVDIHPLVPGHVLVISKNQTDHFDDLPDEDYQALFAAVKKVAKRVKRVMGAKRACVRIMGFDVPHAHVHVYPCDDTEDFYGDIHHMEKEPDHPALAKMAEKLKFE